MPSKVELRNDLQSRIDEQLVKIKKICEALDEEYCELAKRCMHLNGVQPIGMLPPELLVQIFEIDRRCSSSFDKYNWVRLTHVCSHWRAVAHKTPTLWSLVIISRPIWAKKMLERSTQAPLEVDWEKSSSSWTRWTDSLAFAKRLFTSNSYRIVVLRVCMGVKDYAEVQASIPSFFPILRDVSVTVWSLVSGATVEIPTWPLQSPSIKHISFWGHWGRLALSAFAFHDALESLSFGSLSSCGIIDFQLQSVLSALTGAPSLRRLTLLDIFGDATQDLSHLPSVHLPRLDSLHIRDPLECCVWLIKQVIIPPTAEMNIITTAASDEDIAHLTITLAEKLNTQYSLPIIRLVDGHHDTGRRFSVIISSSLDTRTVLTAFCHRLPLSNVRSLELAGMPDNAAFQGTIAAMPYIASLQLRGACLDSLPILLKSELEEDDRRPGARHEPPHLMPYLQHLMIAEGYRTRNFSKVCEELKHTLRARGMDRSLCMTIRFSGCRQFDKADYTALVSAVAALYDRDITENRSVWIQAADEPPVRYRDFIWQDDWVKRADNSPSSVDADTVGIAFKLYVEK
ncbi:unnamed protein product [Somion occarium]|uniref:F-box domain-containing protein n=1 Tax=Somion occarium TaxID=3059160 RepID=A0ABP1E8T6_9APHY